MGYEAKWTKKICLPHLPHIGRSYKYTSHFFSETTEVDQEQVQRKAKLVCILTFHLHYFMLLLEGGVGVGLLLPFLYLCGAATCPPLELIGDLAK